MTGNAYAIRSVQQGAGRSVIAANLAFELAANGRRTILVDLDTDWPSLHRYFNLPREQAAVVAAARLLSMGKLDANAMEDISLRLVARGIGIDFLSGYRLNKNLETTTADSIRNLVTFLQNRFDSVILDLPAGPQLNMLDCFAPGSFTNIWVTQIDAISLGRFVEAQPAAAGTGVAAFSDVLVLNRMRGSVLGARPEWQVQQILRDRTSFKNAIVIPEDPIFDEALLKGLPLRQIAGKSKALSGLSELAGRLQ